MDFAVKWHAMVIQRDYELIYENLQVTKIALFYFSIKPIKEGGFASVVVEDEDLEGSKAMIVLIDNNGQLVAQKETVV